MAEPDIRILVGSEVTNSANQIRKELEKALESGIKINVKLDDKSFEEIKKQLNSLSKDIKINVNSESTKKSTAVPVADYTGATKSTKAMSQAQKELTDAKTAGIRALNAENLAATQEINNSRKAAEAAKAETAEIRRKETARKADASAAKSQAAANKQMADTQTRSEKISAQAKSGLSNFNEYLRTVKPSALREWSSEIDKIRDNFTTAMNGSGEAAKKTFDQANNGVKTLKANFKDVGAEGGNIFTYLHGKLKTFAVYLASSALTMGFVSAFKNAINVVYDLDKALTNLRLVMNGPKASTQELLNTYNQMAQELGSTTTVVANSANDWLRQGYSVADTNKLIQDSMALSVAGQMDSASATDALTAAMKGNHNIPFYVQKCA